nr:LuxR C-terminal-related transcriptional regulator [Patulibacter americanus]
MIGGPPAPGRGTRTLLPRRALVEALDRASTSRVTVLAAAPGSGKSVLLRQWATGVEPPRRVAAVTVRRSERDARHVLLDLLRAVTALDRSAAPRRAPTPGLDAGDLVGLVVDAARTLDAPLVVVIDDLHELEAPRAHQALEALIDRLPTTATFVLACRRDPPLHLHHLRLEGELAELRSADLTLDLEETRALVAATGVTLGADATRALHERTEGWTAGVRLAAIALRGHSAPEDFVAAFSGSDRTVAEYLLAEMLERQPPDVRRLLLRTSLVDRVSGALADALTDGVGSQATLQDLEDANAFVHALDPGRTWFRYHQLFGDLLRLELRRTAPGDVVDLHRRAATWFAEHDLPVEAIRHAQAAEDWARAARLLADHALSLTLDGEDATVDALLRTFPPAALEADPELLTVAASAQLARGSLRDADAYLGLATARRDDVADDRRPTFDVALAAARLSLARRRGDVRDVVEQVELLSRTATARSYAEVALGGELRAVALLHLGIVEMWSMRLDDARAHLQEAAEVARRIGRVHLEVSARAQLGFAAVGVSLAEARARSAEAVALAERHGLGRDPAVTVALAAHAGALVFAGEHARAAALLDAAELALTAEAEPATALLVRLTRGMWSASRGRWDDALAQFRTGEQAQGLLVTQHALAAQLHGFRVAAQIRTGDLDGARATVTSLVADEARAGESLTAVAHVHLADGAPGEALAVLTPVLDGRAPVLQASTTALAEVLAARAWAELGDRTASEAALERALDLCEAEHLVLPFVMAGGEALLRRHPRHATAHAQLVTDVLDGGAAGHAPAAEPLEEPLSPSELRVLGHLPSNLTTPEIAAELFLSANTVKTHVRRVYAKLGAHDRSGAVRRARELGLLGRVPR